MPTGTSAPWQQVPMPAVDLRRLIAASIPNEGVQHINDGKVTQKAGGANMSVDVAAGRFYVKDDHAGGDGYYWAKVAATENVTITTADATNPRIDRIILEVRDAFFGDATNDWRLRAVAGTPTAGATLVNLNGAAAVPSNSLLLGNVLVGAGVTSITDANIDTALYSVRTQIGTYAYTEFSSSVSITAASESGANTIVTAPAVTFDGATAVRIEFFAPEATPPATAGETIILILFEDGTSIGRLGVVKTPAAAATTVPVSVTRKMTPASGSRTYSIRARISTAGTGSVAGGAGGNAVDFPGFIRITPA